MTSRESPGQSSEVSWPLGSTVVHGTSLRPEGPGPFPAVVMVAGSGPTDRDWCSPLLPGTNGSASMLSEALASAGIASIRYDKRASGPHARENAAALIGQISMQSHVDELAGAVQTIAGMDHVRVDRIFALTNSEGALHALNYQLGRPEIPFAGLVLTAPPGRPVGVVGRAQLAAQASALPNANQLLDEYDQSIARFLAGRPAAPDPSLPQGVKLLLSSLENPANLPFSRELWVADASTLLAQIDVPALVVIGKKDIQVDWLADGGPLQLAAAGHPDIGFMFPENANHVLKYEKKPRSELVATEVAAGYNAPDARLDLQVRDGILAWLAAHE